jgi:hypothetical protein
MLYFDGVTDPITASHQTAPTPHVHTLIKNFKIGKHGLRDFIFTLHKNMKNKSRCTKVRSFTVSNIILINKTVPFSLFQQAFVSPLIYFVQKNKSQPAKHQLT